MENNINDDKKQVAPQLPQEQIQFDVNSYTILAVLRKMKESLGLEVMLEYLDLYLSMIEKYNPKVKMAVEEALKRFSVISIYKEASACKRRDSLYS